MNYVLPPQALIANRLSRTPDLKPEAVQAFRREARDALQEIANELTDSSLRDLVLSRSM